MSVGRAAVRKLERRSTAARLLPLANLLVAGLFGLAVLGLPRVCLAGDARSRTTADVASRSVYVVLAECVSVDVAPVEKFAGNLFTFSRFRVEANVVGDLESEFTLRLFGGRTRAVEIDVPLAPRFRPGERVVLMLGRKNADGYPIVSVHGVFRLRDDPAGGGQVVETAITGLALPRADAGAPARGVRLDDFLQALEARLRGESIS